MATRRPRNATSPAARPASQPMLEREMSELRVVRKVRIEPRDEVHDPGRRADVAGDPRLRPRRVRAHGERARRASSTATALLAALARRLARDRLVGAELQHDREPPEPPGRDRVRARARARQPRDRVRPEPRRPRRRRSARSSSSSTKSSASTTRTGSTGLRNEQGALDVLIMAKTSGLVASASGTPGGPPRSSSGATTIGQDHDRVRHVTQRHRRGASPRAPSRARS